MNMFKRMASLVVMAVMMLQIAAFAAPVPEDVIGTEYEAAASLLCALDIMVGDGTNFNPDDNITRAEFAQILMKTLRLDAAAEAYSPAGLFTDVPKDNIFAPAVELGAGIGAIKGYGDGTFGPDNNVLGTEAVKMMTYACGHDITAEMNGGYPAGYMTTAQDIGLLKGLSGVDYSVPMTRGQAAILCTNTLKVDMKKKVSTGDKITYVETKDVNLLSEKFDVYKVDGIVTANDVTSMWGSSSLRDDTVQIEYGNQSGIYEVGATTVSSALGKYICAYYKYDKDMDTYTVMSYEVLGNKNEITTVDLADIDYNSLSATKVEYWKDKENDTRTTELKIASTPSIIFNGATRTKNNSVVATFDEIKGQSGEVTFLDYDADGTVDVVNVMAYETMVVKSINSKDYELNDEIGTYEWSDKTNAYVNKTKNIQIDIESDNVTAVFTDVDGAEMEFSDISVGDVLSIARSDEGASRQYFDVKICNDSVDAELNQLGKKDNRYVLTLDDTKYEVTDSYMGFITDGEGMSKPTTALKIKIGSTGEFFLDAFGKVAYSKLSGMGSDATFGFMVAYQEGRYGDDDVQFKIYSDGAYEVYTAASRVEIDGVGFKGTSNILAGMQKSMDEVNKIITYYDDASEDQKGKMSAVLFTLNADGQIKAIDTPYFNKDGGESEYSLQPVEGKSLGFQSGLRYLKNTSSLGGTLIKLDPNAPIIQLPGNASALDTVSKMSVIKGSAVPNEKTFDNLQLFATEPKSSKVTYAVSKAKAGASAGSSKNLGDTDSQIHDAQIFVVSEVTRVLNSEGFETIGLIGYQEGKQKEYTVDYDYYSDRANGLYYDVVRGAPGKENGAARFQKYFDEGAATISPERNNDILLPGDAIRVRLNDAGEVSFVSPNYLSAEKLFRADDQGRTVNATRYRAMDIGVVYQKDGDEVSFRYLLDKSQSNESNSTMIITNDKGYITGTLSKDSQTDAALTLYDSETGSYILNDTTGMRKMESYNVSSFKDKITVFDAKNTDNPVTAGTVDDLNDIDSLSSPASLVIMQFRSSSPRGMYIIKY